MSSGTSQGSSTSGSLTKAIKSVTGAASNADKTSGAKSKDGESTDEVAAVGQGEKKDLLTSGPSRLSAAIKGGVASLLPIGSPAASMFGPRFNPLAGLFPSVFGGAGGGGANDAWAKSVATTDVRDRNGQGYNGGHVDFKPLGEVDLSKIDPDGSKLKMLMAAIRVEEVGQAVFNGNVPAGTEVTGKVKENIVKNIAAMYGNDDVFMSNIQKNGYKIVLADHIAGETYVGGGIGGYCDPGNRMAVFAKGSLDKYTLGHEFAHARDAMDGRMDGIYADVPGFRDALNATINRISRGEGMHMSRIGYGYANYTNVGDGGVEVLATTAENYFNNNAEFRKVFPEMSEAYDKAFKPMFDNLDGNFQRPIQKPTINEQKPVDAKPVDPRTTSVEPKKEEVEKAILVTAVEKTPEEKKREEEFLPVEIA
jgi:hypothetical protein